jgi:DNA-binding GntR family transcriptional regulator
MTARHAALQITDDEIRELTDLHHRMLRCVTPQDLPEYRELNRRFHSLIFTASHRSYLIRSLGQLWAAFPTMLWSNIPHAAKQSAPGRDEADAAEHEAIVRAITARDPDAAEAAVRAHIEAAGKALLAVLQEAS